MCNPSPVGLVLSANHSTSWDLRKGGPVEQTENRQAYNSGGPWRSFSATHRHRAIGQSHRAHRLDSCLTPSQAVGSWDGDVISYICPASPARSENPVHLRHFYQSIPLQMDTNGSLPHTNQTHLRVW